MFLKILPDLDMPLISLDTKNHYPKFNGLGDMAIVISETQIPFFLGHPVQKRQKCKNVKNVKSTKNTKVKNKIKTLGHQLLVQKSTINKISDKIFMIRFYQVLNKI